MVSSPTCRNRLGSGHSPGGSHAGGGAGSVDGWDMVFSFDDGHWFEGLVRQAPSPAVS
jgi:hypothetical protein